MDYFSRLLKHLEDNGSIRGISFNNDCKLSHILFADDILHFIDDNNSSLKNLYMAIKPFEKAFGMNINLAKSLICL